MKNNFSRILCILCISFVGSFLPLRTRADFDPNQGSGLEEVAFPSSIPATPVIRSTTHPDASRWYSEKSARFEWDIPTGITAIKISLTKDAQGEPDRLYRNGLNEIGIGDLEEGIWYFNLQIANLLGWSETAHYQIRVDQTPPTNVSVKDIPRTDSTDPDLQFIITASDSTSGIEKITAEYEGAKNIPLQPHPSEKDTYVLQDVPSNFGELTLFIHDGAGNAYPIRRNYNIKPLEKPFIQDSPQKNKPNEQLIFTGHCSYPKSTAYLQIKDENGSQQTFQTTADESGFFTFGINQKYMDGRYSATVFIKDQRGARSLEAGPILFTIETPFWASMIFSLLLLTVGLIVILIIVHWRQGAGRREEDRRKAIRIAEIREEIAKRKKVEERGLVKTPVKKGQANIEDLENELRELTK